MKSLYTLLIISLFAYLPSRAQVPGTWYTSGIGGGGALYSPSINPGNPEEIYMSCDMGEVFHSNDQGFTWKDVPFQQLQGGYDACVQFTSDPLVRYCIDYSSIQGVDYIRPMKSTDGGNTWNVITTSPYPLQPNGDILRLLVSYANPDLIMIADYGTIYFSSDGGATFHLIHTCISNGSGNHIAGLFFDSPDIYIGTNDGLLASTDNGQTFNTMNVNGIPANEYILSFAGARNGNTLRFYCLTSANVWAGYQYGSNYWNAMKGVYRMDNANGTWVSEMNGISIGTDFPVFVGMSAWNTDVAYISGGNSNTSPIVMKSTAGGDWTHVFLTNNNQNIYTGWAGYGGDHGWSFPEAPFGFTVAYNDASTVMLTDYSCAHITTDGGATWHQQYLGHDVENPMNSPTPTGKKYHGCGLENTSCWQILWADSLNLLAGFSDINGIMTDNSGESWKFIPDLSLNTVYRIIKHSNGKLYAAASNIHDMYQSTRIYDAQIDAGTGAVYVSSDNGNSFSLLHNFGHPVVWIATDPSDPETMYASVLHHNSQTTGGIWMTSGLSSGTSATWTKLSAPPRSNGHPFNINVLNNGDLVCSFSARKPTGSVAFTDSSGVYYYSKASSTWLDRSDANMRFWTQDVVVDPNDATQNTWYACVFEGWGTQGIQGTGGLFRTTDKGLSWTRINDDYRVNSCAILPGNANELYFTTETDGLWYTSNAASSSPQFSQVANYPFRHPMRVFFNPYNSSEPWVTSFGNGIMKGGDSATGILLGPSAVIETIKLYPNPCREQVTIRILYAGSEPGFSFTICDVAGKDLMHGTLTSPDRHVIDVSCLAAGFYSLQVFRDGRPSGNAKLVKL
jgi:photosystem II stability/assembly factor-like uncharacterized protein